MNDKQGQKHLNANERRWKKTIAEWRASQQTTKIFCREHRFNESTFYFWRKRLDPNYPSKGRISSLTRAEGPSAFVPVVLENPQTPYPKTGIKFYYPNGCFMLLEEGFHLPLFQTLLEATRTSLCS